MNQLGSAADGNNIFHLIGKRTSTAEGEELFRETRGSTEEAGALSAAERSRSQERDVFVAAANVDVHRCGQMLGCSPVMRRLFEDVATVARADTTVLIHGETGTGKELIARSIHALSARRERAMVRMNCAALPAELIESEMFGHEKGSFTGATCERKGRFELADGGTLFLDEVGELSPAAQAKLLRVLQEQEFERVGGSRVIKVDVRVVAATNRDLGAMVKAGAFRSDLYYRLNVFPLSVPPLRERREDISLLVDNFLARFAQKLGRPLVGLDAGSMAILQAHDWPGNVRELQNVIERAVVLSGGPLVVVPANSVAGSGATQRVPDLRTLEAVECAHIRQVLESTEWVIEGRRGAAAILGMEPSTLRYRMQKLGIRRPRATTPICA